MKWKKNRYLCLTILTFFGLFCSCEKVTLEAVKVSNVSFKNDVVPIFSKNCAGCHDGVIQKPDLKADSAYNTLTRGGYYNKTTPAKSIIVVQLNTNASHISKANDVEKATILQWIVEGAKNN